MVITVNIPSAVCFVVFSFIALSVIPAPYRGVLHPSRDVLCADQLWGEVVAVGARTNPAPAEVTGFALSGVTHGGSVSAAGVFSGLTVGSINDGTPLGLDGMYTPFTVLIVNVASKCGYTAANYKWLNKMEGQYGRTGGGRLRIVAFPSYQFNDQEFHSSDMVREFVRGAQAAAFDVAEVVPTLHSCNSTAGQLYSRLLGQVGLPGLSWNFDKFLLAPGGVVLEHFAASVPLEVVEWEVTAALHMFS